MSTKTLKYLMFDTKGNAQFTCEVYTDNHVFNPLDGTTRTPATSMTFVGSETGGFGDGDQPYGGGRGSVDQRPWAMPSKFKLMKMRMSGSTSASLGLEFVGISFGYAMGKLYR